MADLIVLLKSSTDWSCWMMSSSSLRYLSLSSSTKRRCLCRGSSCFLKASATRTLSSVSVRCSRVRTESWFSSCAHTFKHNMLCFTVFSVLWYYLCLRKTNIYMKSALRPLQHQNGTFCCTLGNGISFDFFSHLDAAYRPLCDVYVIFSIAQTNEENGWYPREQLSVNPAPSHLNEWNILQHVIQLPQTKAPGRQEQLIIDQCYVPGRKQHE